MASPESDLIARIGGGERRPLYLVTGEILLAQAAGLRIAEALAAAGEAELQTFRHPESLSSRIGDLRTYSLFGGAKLVVIIDSGVLADRRGAAHLIDQAAEALPISAEGELNERGRQAAGRLLQVCRLFGVEAYAGSPEEVIAALPDWVFGGGAPPGGRGRAKKRLKAAATELKGQLAELLSAAAAAGLEGWAETDAADLASVAKDGLPEGHHLVLCEVAVAADHPVVEVLRSEGALLELTRVGADRQGRWQGLGALADELEQETGAKLARPALDELGRRTLRSQGGRDGGIDADSTARFAAEYRKLASLAESGHVDLDLVRDVVEDRGEEDMFKMMDAISDGRSGEALTRIERLIEGSEDAVSARLSFFGRLAVYCNQLTAVAGMIDACGIPADEQNYNRFKTQIAPRFDVGVPEFGPVMRKLHPYPLHRIYKAAGRYPKGRLAALPAKVLETEMRLKGESADPQAALAALVVYLSTAAAGS